MRATPDPHGGEDRLAQPDPTNELLEKMRSGLAGAGLECHCRDKIDGLLEQLRKSLWRQERAQALSDARSMRDRIVGFLGFLEELDELTPEEQDFTCFQEAALIFEDMRAAARMGAVAARRVAAINAALLGDVDRH